MTETRTRTRGRCRVCGYSHRLDEDGRLSGHPSPVPGEDQCGGVGYLPEPEPAR